MSLRGVALRRHDEAISCIVYAGLTTYVLIGIYFEERKLLCEFGQAYAQYQSVTPMLVPALQPGGNK